MRVDPAGSDNAAFACDHLGSRSDNYFDVRLHIGIASLAYCSNTPILNGNIGLRNSPMVENQRVGDDGIDRALTAGTLRLTHAVADDFPASKLHLFAISREVVLHLDGQVGIGEAYLVPDGRTKHLRIGGTAHSVGHAGYLNDPGEKSSRWYLWQCSHDGLVEAKNQARAPVGDQANFAGEARLEAHRRSRRNVQAIPKGSLSIKSESPVGLSKMIMASDLDRSVACVGDSKRDGCSILVQDNLASRRKNLARYHVNPPFPKRTLVRRKPAGASATLGE